MERPRYRQRCKECRAFLNREEILCGDRMCTSCIDHCMAKVRAQRNNKPEPPSPDATPDVAKYYA